MNTLSYRIVLAFGLLAAGSAFAQAPTTAPAGSTGQCKDDSYTTHATKAGACAGHKGVKDWYATTAAKTTAPAVAAVAPVAPVAPVAAAAPAAKVEAPAAKATKTSAAPVTQAPGGGAGQVWVNGPSKVYHCFGTKYYGKTKQGQYMTEAAAKAAGNHADHGKACAS